MESLNTKEVKKNEKSIKYKKEYNAKLVECECGLICRYSNIFRHYKSYRHTLYLESKKTIE